MDPVVVAVPTTTSHLEERAKHLGARIGVTLELRSNAILLRRSKTRGCCRLQGIKDTATTAPCLQRERGEIRYCKNAGNVS